MHQHHCVRHQRGAAAGPLQPAAGRVHTRRQCPRSCVRPVAVRPEPNAHAAACRERPVGQHPARNDGHLPVVLDRVRRALPRRSLRLLDHHLGLLDRPAIPDCRVGLDVPAVRLEPRLRPEPHPQVPGHHARASGCG